MKRHHRKRFEGHVYGEHPCAELAAHWALRILLDLESWRGMRGYPQNLTFDGAILKTFGLGYLEDKDISKKKFLEKLRERQSYYENRHAGLSDNLRDNLASLGDLVGLTQVECDLLAFAVVLHSHEGLNNTGDTLNEITSEGVSRLCRPFWNCRTLPSAKA